MEGIQDLMFQQCHYTLHVAQGLQDNQVLQRLEVLRQYRDRWERPAPHQALKSSENLREWTQLILEDREWPDQGCFNAFSQVLHAHRFGGCEGNRILYHLLKDSSSSQRSWRDPSRWMERACREALRAMGEPDLWTGGSRRPRVWSS